MSKKYSTELRTEIADLDAEYMERKSCRELTFGIKSLCRVFPNLQTYISPALETIHDIQQDIGNLNLKVLDHTHSNLWQTSICVNSQTEQLHIENDCTYTIITIPRQDSKNGKQEYNFITQLMDNHDIGIKCDEGVSFLFSGKYLTHRQSCNNNTTSCESTFISIASYGNARLYNHLKITIKRVKG